jgi:hypothetical protein
MDREELAQKIMFLTSEREVNKANGNEKNELNR